MIERRYIPDSKRGPTVLLRKYLPSCCWQTAFEILTMLEQVNENIVENSLKTALSTAAVSGVVEKRRLKTKPLYKTRCERKGRKPYVEYRWPEKAAPLVAPKFVSPDF